MGTAANKAKIPKISWFFTVLSLYFMAENTMTIGADRRIQKFTNDTGRIFTEALKTTISRKVLKNPALKTSGEVKDFFISDKDAPWHKQKTKVVKLDTIK